MSGLTLNGTGLTLVTITESIGSPIGGSPTASGLLWNNAGVLAAGPATTDGTGGIQLIGNTPILATSTTAGAGAGPTSEYFRNILGANGNGLALFNFTGQSTAGTKRTYAYMRASVLIATDGAEVGTLTFGGINGLGAQADVMLISGQTGPSVTKMGFATSLGTNISNIGVTGTRTFWQERQNGLDTFSLYQAANVAGQTGDIGIGKGSANATTATTGFLLLPGGAGPPTGVPVNAGAGKNVLYVDETNSQLYLYIGGAWKQPMTPAGAALVTWQ